MKRPHRPKLSDDYSPEDRDRRAWAAKLGPTLGEVLDRTRGEPSTDYYAQDWEAISNSLRAEMDWCCERCGINLGNRHDLLHVHHRDRNKLNNERWNLLVVCARCHSGFPSHGHIWAALSNADRVLLSPRR
jgi:5-methylcytosine-specific restriction endonuclease McrA